MNGNGSTLASTSVISTELWIIGTLMMRLNSLKILRAGPCTDSAFDTMYRSTALLPAIRLLLTQCPSRPSAQPVHEGLSQRRFVSHCMSSSKGLVVRTDSAVSLRQRRSPQLCSDIRARKGKETPCSNPSTEKDIEECNACVAERGFGLGMRTEIGWNRDCDGSHFAPVSNGFSDDHCNRIFRRSEHSGGKV